MHFGWYVVHKTCYARRRWHYCNIIIFLCRMYYYIAQITQATQPRTR